MKTRIAICAGMIGFVWAAYPSASGADEETKPVAKATAEGATPSKPAQLVPSGGLPDAPPEQSVIISGKPVFVPPNRGTPAARVGGAARSVGQLPGIEALVPLESGLTLKPQPVLYWYLSADTSLPVNFTLIDIDQEEPLLDVTLPGPFQKGVHAIRLDDHPTTLSQGRLYQWFVALVADPEDRSGDRLAGGGIEVVDMKEWLRVRIAQAPPEDLPAILAGAGVWYDALNLLSDRVAEDPSDPTARAERAALFEQVGLEAVVVE